ncbi:hypothetical protein CU014_2628 [Enterococcus xinjiangensis]|uniref:CfrBI family restriction endonuclease n=1 Tax=Enterococcus TaxID=1350 RepID=UPI001F4005D5|nr:MULTISPECIES: CfrBI family restriction endonuclease [Enterococcus]MBL4998779.1 hypothetical protein [Enterococcus lactis]
MDLKYSEEETQLIVQLNMDSILSEEKNLNHVFTSSLTERKLKNFLSATSYKGKKYIEEIVEQFILEFNTTKKELYDDKQFLMFKKYNSHFRIVNNYKNEATKVIKGGAKTLLSQLGDQSIDNIVISVLQGGNVRDVTELITRTKLLLSNAALLDLLLSLNNESDINIKEFFEYLKKNIQLSADNSENMLLTLWTLGLTKKSLDNIVRGRANLEEYINNLNRTLDEAVSNIEDLFGNISGEINLNGKIIEVNWDFISLLFTAIGAQTLTIRGSDKSTNGKFFERLILGSSLSMMGFQYMEEMPEEVSPSDKLFILSSTESNERETDATVIYNNKAISIDIGFIGGGNPEISADKVTRFRSDKIIGKIDHQMVPLIIVDTINNKTVIKSIASSLGGTAIEMRDKYWIRNMAKFISDYFDINCYFEELEDLETLHSEISVKLKELDLQMFTSINIERDEAVM